MLITSESLVNIDELLFKYIIASINKGISDK